MTDPRRLTAGSEDLGSAELTRWLIDSARTEEPATEALQRTLLAAGATGAVLVAATTTGSASAVGSAAAGTAATSAASSGAVSSATGAAMSTGAAASTATVAGAGASAAAAGKAAGLSLLGAAGKGAAVKWLAVSVLGGATLLGGSKLLTSGRVANPAPQHTQNVSEKAASPVAVQREAAQATAPIPAEQPIAIPAENSLPERAPKVANEPAATAPANPEVIEATALHKEVQLIDRAREAKASGQHARVIVLTQQYLSEFPRGRLMPEAIFLKMESESASGRTQQASQSAKLLLRVAPKSPQAARARELSETQTP